MALEEEKEEHSGGGMERWLLTYADMITLLMIFFIIMYSISRVDLNKFIVIKQTFGLEFGTPYIIGKEPGKARVEPETPNPSNPDETEKMEDVRKRLQELIAQAGLQNQVTIFVSERGLVIRVKEALFFPTGSADLNGNGKDLINKLGATMKVLPNFVRVEGHTDNVPIHNQRFASNWELSAMRATNVAKQLIEGAGYDPRLLSADAFAEYRPIASNQSEEGRQKNRRVDIVVIKTSLNKVEPKNQ